MLCLDKNLILFLSSPTICMIYTSHQATLAVSTYSAVKWGYTIGLVGIKVVIFREFASFQLILYTRNMCVEKR